MTATSLVGFNDQPGSYWFLLAPATRTPVPRQWENRLTGMTGAATATHVYDGDGVRVRAVITTPVSISSVYVGNYFEITGGITRTYYYAGNVRVAERYSNTLYYLLTDHLGSTAVTTDASGNRVTELRYYPYGGDRYNGTNQKTTYRFTGQRWDPGTALYFYGSRWYDPVIGRFIQADTIVPQPGNPQALNRYAYVLNNPLRFTDPTGMFSEDEIMQYYGVKTWEEVLAIFGKGGKLEGQWGWLETLRQAKLGDEVWFNANASLTSPDAENGVQFKGVFAEDKEGHLRIRNLSGDGSQDNLLLDPDAVVRAQASTSYALFRNDPSSQLTPRLWVGEWQANKQYLHLQSVNWDYLLNPIAVSHLVESTGITLFTGGLAVGQFAAAGALCVEPVTCAGGVLMGINGVASLTATYFLGQGTVALAEHYWHESTAYGP